MSSTAMVTGASSGIGEAICRLLIVNDYRVVGAARNLDKLIQLAQALGENFHPCRLDVNDADAVTALAASLPDDFCAIDVLINNAGHDIGGRKPFESSDAEQLCDVIDTNVKGVIRVTRAIINGMLERGRGHVVNVGSICGLKPFAQMSAYVASKYAVHGFSETLRLEYASKGIRVSEILPGLVRTGFAEQRFGDAQQADAFYESFEVYLQPQDIADTVLYALRQPRHVEISQLVVMPVS